MALTTKILIGNLTHDPELSQTRNGNSYVRFTVAESARKKTENGWENGDTLFMRCTAFDSQYQQLATNIANTLRKGSAVIVVGRMRTEKWTDSDGAEHRDTVMIVDHAGLDLTKAGKPQARAKTNTRPAPSQPSAGHPSAAQPSRDADPWAGGFEQNPFAEPDF